MDLKSIGVSPCKLTMQIQILLTTGGTCPFTLVFCAVNCAFQGLCSIYRIFYELLLGGLCGICCYIKLHLEHAISNQSMYLSMY